MGRCWAKRWTLPHRQANVRQAILRCSFPQPPNRRHRLIFSKSQTDAQTSKYRILRVCFAMASPDAPRTTSAPAPVRGIDRQASGETRLRLDTSQLVSSPRRPARQQPPDRTRNRLLRSPGARTLTVEVQTPELTIAPRHRLAQPPCDTMLPLACHPGVHLRHRSTNSRGCLARQRRPAQPPCDTKTPLVRSPGYALAAVVQIPEGVLRVGIALFCRLAIPKRSLSNLSSVPMHNKLRTKRAMAVIVQVPQGVLRVGGALLSRLAKPINRLSVARL